MKVADNVQFSCINKRQHHNPRERIENVGGTHACKPWKLTESQAIAGIKEGKRKFYTSMPDVPARPPITIASSPS